MDKMLFLKNQLVRTSLIMAGALLVSMLLYFYLGTELSDTTRYTQQLENEIISLQRQATDTKNKNELIARSVRIYYTLPDKQRNQPTLEDTAARIRTARPIIDELRIRYKFSSLNANFTKVEEVTKEFDSKHVRVYRNTITLDFKALTDELVLSFLDDFANQAPGFITLTSFTLTKESDVTPAVIKALLTRQATIPYLVNGKATLMWWSLTEIKPVGGPAAEGAAPAATPPKGKAP